MATSIIKTDEIRRLNDQVLMSDGALTSNVVFPAGHVLQVVNATTSSGVTTTTQNSWTTTNLSASITPSSSSSKILVLVQQKVAAFGNGDLQVNLGLFRDATLIYGALSWDDLRVATISTCWAFNIPIVYLDSPATTSSITYATALSKRSTAVTQVVASGNGGLPDSIVLMEIAA